MLQLGQLEKITAIRRETLFREQHLKVCLSHPCRLVIPRYSTGLHRAILQTFTYMYVWACMYVSMDTPYHNLMYSAISRCSYLRFPNYLSMDAT